MIKLSKNKKLNKVLLDILIDLVELDEYGELNEVERYRKNFPNEIDYNIFQYGNMRVYWSEIFDLYKDYNSLKNASAEKLESIYKRQIRYIANYYLYHREEVLKEFKNEKN